MFVGLNRFDLLKAKLESGVRLNQYLLTYGERPNDYESVSRYLRNKFGLLHQQYTPNPNRELFSTSFSADLRPVVLINSFSSLYSGNGYSPNVNDHRQWYAPMISSVVPQLTLIA